MTTFRSNAVAMCLLVAGCGASPAEQRAERREQPRQQVQKIEAKAERHPSAEQPAQSLDQLTAALIATDRKSDPDHPDAIIKVERLLEMPFGPVLIISEDLRNTGVAAPGGLSIHYLQREGSKFRLVKSWLRELRGEPYGTPPTWSVTKRLTVYPAILGEEYGGRQGLYCRWTQIVELTPTGPVNRMDDVTGITIIPLPYDGPPERQLRGRITNVQRGHSFDVKVTGTDRFTVHYSVQDGRFQAVNPNHELDC